MLIRSTSMLALIAWLSAANALVHADSALGSAPERLAEGEQNPADGKLPKCVHVRAEARYGAFGYDHHVEIDNGCDKTVHCTVKTNVNSDQANVDVPAGETRSIVTFRGSPAREFQADVACKRQA